MSVYKNPKSPYWQYDFQCRGVRQYGSLTVRADRPKREAEKAEKVLKSAIGHQDGKPRMTLDLAGDRYWDEHAKRFKDKAGEKGRLNHLRRLIGKETYLDEVGDSDLSRYVATRRGEQKRGKKKDRPCVSPATINRELECFGRLNKRADKSWKVQASEANISAHKLPEPKERVRSLTSDEDTELFKAIDELRPDFHDVWEFKLLSTKRLSEVIGLLKRRVDRKNRRATVIQKGGQEITIHLTDSLLAIIERNWLNHPTHVFTYICKKGRVGRKKGKRYPFTKDGWRKEWKVILTKAGIEDFRVHDLRHTGATRILAATGNLKAVQKALGHSTIAATARYAHTDDDQIRDALDAAERMRSPGHDSRNDKSQSEKKSGDGSA